MGRNVPHILVVLGALTLIAAVSAPALADGLTVPFQLWTLGVGTSLLAAGAALLLMR